MAEYTMYLRDVINMVNGNIVTDMESDIEKAIPKIFSFPVTAWVEGYENVLFTKFCERYYMREICAETYPLWKVFLKRHIQLVMPYYNNLYKTTIYEFNPETNVDLLVSHIGNDTENLNINRTNESSTIQDSKNVTEQIYKSVSDSNTNDSIDKTFSKNDSETTGYGKVVNTVRTPALNTHTTANSSGNSSTNVNSIDSDFPNSKSNNVFNYASTGTDGNTETNTTDNSTTDTTESGTDTTKTTDSGTDTKTIKGTDTEKGTETNTSKTETENESNSTTTGNASTTGNVKENDTHDRIGTNQYETKTIGNDGRYTLAYLIKEYRDILINIDEIFLNECEKLFMSIW